MQVSVIVHVPMKTDLSKKQTLNRIYL